MAESDKYTERFIAALRAKGIDDGELDGVAEQIFDRALETVAPEPFITVEINQHGHVLGTMDRGRYSNAILARAMDIAETPNA